MIEFTPPSAAGPETHVLTPPALVAAWRREESARNQGWSFAHLQGRLRETEVPWNLVKIYREALGLARHVLDMGTGGGEFLSQFRGVLPRDVVATEGWAPNVAVARENLAPLGISVVEHSTELGPMPFPDQRFDLVLNRHEAYDPVEVARVLAPGGAFVTQQVGGLEFAELHALTGKRPDHPEITFEKCRDGLADAGLEVVDDGEDVGWYEFVDVAALVAYLQLVPWDVPDDFSVDRYLPLLWELHQRGPAHGAPIRMTKIRFWLRARKPIT